MTPSNKISFPIDKIAYSNFRSLNLDQTMSYLQADSLSELQDEINKFKDHPRSYCIVSNKYYLQSDVIKIVQE